MNLFEGKRLSAKITERQCKLNRNGYKSKGIEVPPHISCQGCAGLGEPAQVSLPEQKEIAVKKLKHIYCACKGCYRTVKQEGGYCKVHQGLADQVEAGTVAGSPAPAASTSATVPAPQNQLIEIEAGSICAVCVGDCNAGPTPCQPGTLTECVNFTPWRRDDERTQAMLGLVGCTVSLELLGQQSDQDVKAAEFYAGAVHLQASDNDDVPIPPMPFFLKGTQAQKSHLEVAKTEGAAEESVLDVLLEVVEEHEREAEEIVHSTIQPTPKATGLQALLRTPPPAPDGIFIPFTREETIALIESDVSAENIRQFVLLGLQGEVCRIDNEDPLAKSRREAA